MWLAYVVVSNVSFRITVTAEVRETEQENGENAESMVATRNFAMPAIRGGSSVGAGGLKPPYP